jgi:hypothetical protein
MGPQREAEGAVGADLVHLALVRRDSPLHRARSGDNRDLE